MSLFATESHKRCMVYCGDDLCDCGAQINPCANGHDLVSRGDGTARCFNCGELADVSETGAARSGRVENRQE